MQTVSSKLPETGISIFAHISALATKHNALNLGQGFPDFDPPEDLVRKVNEAMKNGHNQYAPMPGIISLREKIAALVENVYGYNYSPETEITVTPGATMGLYAAISAVVTPGDEVIIFEPAYDSYIPAIKLNGGIPVPIKLEFPSYKINRDLLKQAVSTNTKAIIINTPHNPTGSILDADDLKFLEELIRNTSIVVISDEVYEHIIFDNREHMSIARFPELAKRSFLISSFGKTYHTTGWKTGYVCAPRELMAEFRKVFQFMVFSVNSAQQHAFATILDNPEGYLGLKSFYSKRRDYFRAAIDTSKFRLLDCAGTYFQLLEYNNSKPETDFAFCERIVAEHGVAAIPVSSFYADKTDNKVIRICFAKKEETLEKGALLLNKINF